jgi:U3 small nucleolar RNA-associated protein 11
MVANKLDLQKKQHRERSQPIKRAKLGLLEKHADYIKRARDFHSKEDRIKKLREKAASKNKDEFYFAMINSSTKVRPFNSPCVFHIYDRKRLTDD